MCRTQIYNCYPYSGRWGIYYLQSRVLAHCAQDNNYLLSTLGRVIDDLITDCHRDKQHEKKREVSLALSELVAENLGSTYWCALNGHKTERMTTLPDRTSRFYVEILKVYEFQQSSCLGKGQTSCAPEHLLSAAAYVGNISLVEALLAHGVKVNTGSNVFGKPLFAAALAGHLAIVRLLLARGADADDGAYPELRMINDF